MEGARLMLTKDELRDFRTAEGLTQEELAVRLGLKHKDTVRAWESGKTPVSGPASLVIRMVQAAREAGSAVLDGLWRGA